MRGVGLLLICGAGLLRICGAGLLLICGAGLLRICGAGLLLTVGVVVVFLSIVWLRGVLILVGDELEGFVLMVLPSLFPRVIDGCLTSTLLLFILAGVLPVLTELLLSLSDPLLRTSVLLLLTALVLARVDISLVPFSLRLPPLFWRTPVDLRLVDVPSALAVFEPLELIAWLRVLVLDCSSAYLLLVLVRCAKLLLGFCLS
jgi:hypothetical protein